jgi:FkbM family methyltransferase
MNLLSPVKHLVPMHERLRWNVMKAKATGERELAYVNALCDHSSISVDIGANRGVYSFLMRQHSKGVIAFEPNPFYADLVRRALKDVQVIEAAVSDHAGKTILRVPLSQAVAGMGTIEAENTLESIPVHQIEISILTLDSLQLPKMGFIKIDVEGHELAALRGAAATIERCLPNFLIEAEERHRKDAVLSVYGFLSKYGYSGLFHVNGKLHPMEEFNTASYQDISKDANPYVNNFIFVHESKLPQFYDSVRKSAPSHRD